jgi:hypothetical protein
VGEESNGGVMSSATRGSVSRLEGSAASRAGAYGTMPDSGGVLSTIRWSLAAVAVVLGPLFLFVLPGLFIARPAEDAAAQFTAIAEDPSSLDMIGFLSQVLGASLLVPAVIGMVYLLIVRRRGNILGHVAGALALIGALSILVAVGIEIAQTHLLTHGDNTPDMVELALSINESTVFVSFLLTGLLGVFVGSLLLIIALWRARFVPLWILGLFVVPIVIAIALPGRLGEIAGFVAFLVPFGWISWLMLAKPERGIEVAEEEPAPSADG